MTTQTTTLVTIKPEHVLALSKYTPEEINLVKETICRGPSGRPATDTELAFFLYTAYVRKLNPFAKQIYAIWRKPNQESDPVMVLQTSIDGYRAIAAGTKENERTIYAGTDEPEFGPLVQSNNCTHPEWARVVTHRMVQGQQVKFVGYARWSEFYTSLNATMWQKMPYNQLAKCAEAQALRKAFPEILMDFEYREPPEETEELSQSPPPLQEPSPASSHSTDSDPLNLCPLHQVAFFKSERMRTFSHKQGDKWCNRPSALNTALLGVAMKLNWDGARLQTWTKEQWGKVRSAMTDEELSTALAALQRRLESRPGDVPLPDLEDLKEYEAVLEREELG